MKTDLENNNLMLEDVSTYNLQNFENLKYLLQKKTGHVAVFYLFFMTNKNLYLAGNKRIIGIC